MEDWNPGKYLLAFTFLLSSYMLYSSSPILALFFLFHRLAFPLCFSGCMVIPDNSQSSQSHIYELSLLSTSTFPMERVWCQVLLAHSTMAMGWSHTHPHGCELGLIVSFADIPKGIHSISYFSYCSGFSPWLAWPNSWPVLASHSQLCLSSLIDSESLHSVFCSSEGAAFYIWSVVWGGTATSRGSLERLPH